MAEEIARYAGPDNFVFAMGQSDFEAVAKHAGPKSLGHLDAAFHFSLSSASILRRVNADRYGSLLANEGWCYDEFNAGNWRTNAVAPERNAVFGKQVSAGLDVLICLTERIRETASQWNEGAVCIPQGLDTRTWYPPVKQHPKPQLDGIRVGWCGDKGGKRSFKGYDELLVPLRERLRHGVTWDVNDRDHTSAKSRAEMRQWYGGLDLFVCTAINEGGPYPPFEAAACGTAVVSTNVGIVTAWKQAHDLELIAKPCWNDKMAKITLDELEARIVWLRDDPVRREKVSNCLRNSVIEKYNWERLAAKWIGAMVGTAK
jgi:hypothetical protein